MLIYSLNFLLGILIFSSKNTLAISPLEWGVFTLLLLGGLWLFKSFKTVSINIIMLVFGFVWMGIFSSQILSAKVNDKYLNQPINISGKIIHLPEQESYRAKFVFKVKTPFQGKIKLSWYGENVPQLHTGEQWQLLVKLKANNGYQNSPGFDYEKWLFFKQINATGYVRHTPNNQLIQKARTLSIDKIRQDTRNFLHKFLKELEFGGVINALIIGDRSLIDAQHWDLFKATNTTHLSVISGLHIGLISGFIFLLSGFIWRKFTRLTLDVPSQIIGSYAGLIAALLYALMAGFSIPTQRAFIMASVVFLSVILRRRHSVWQLYAIALFLVLATNPVSIFSAGFWLSFYVVAVIIYAVAKFHNLHWFYQLIAIQILISVATIPLVAWFFSSVATLSPVANLVAIPVFSFAIIPLSLIGGLLAFAQLTEVAKIIFEISNQLLIYLAHFLQYLQSFGFNQWHYTPSSVIDLWVLLLIVFIAILPKQLGLRKISILLFAIVLFSPIKTPKQGTVLITTLDVGQGLAQLVQTKNHILLFDSGAIYRSGFNMGDTVIKPYLHAKRVKKLDKIIISHGDNDHIGGLKSVLNEFRAAEILSSVPNKITQTTSQCKAGQNWVWDRVQFEMLNPSSNSNFSGNNASCVLKISTDKYSILLTADIEKKTEKHLLKTNKNKLKSDVLIVPHHGSKSSSGRQFLTAVAPKLAIISSGYKNRFNHPAKVLMDKYQQLGIDTLNTNCSGQIEVLLADKIHIQEYRKNHARYYLRQCTE